MTLGLEDYRRIRDQRESAERAEREQTLREKLFPLLVLDIRGKLTEADGLSLVELLADLQKDIAESNKANGEKIAETLRWMQTNMRPIGVM